MNLIDWLQRLFAPDGGADDGVVERCLEHAVDIIDPKLRIDSAYQRHLREPVARLLRHAEQFAAQVPGPIELGRHEYAADPLVHALFGSADELPRVLGQSIALRDYLEGAPPDESGVYAVMGVRRGEKKVLGVELQGDVIHRDVPQSIVYFSAHTLVGPSTTEADTRRFLARSAFESVAKRLADEITKQRGERKELRAERAMLRAQARSSADEALRKKLSDLEYRLRALGAKLQPKAVRDRIAALMSHPELLLRLETTTERLTRMGVRAGPGSTDSADTIAFPELVGRDRRRWVVVLVHLPKEELGPALEHGIPSQAWIEI